MEQNTKTSFTFPAKWIQPLKNQNKDVRDEVVMAILDYWESGRVVELKPIASSMFSLMRGDIDAIEGQKAELSEVRRAAGRAGAKAKWDGKMANDGKTYNIIEDNIIEDNSIKKEERERPIERLRRFRSESQNEVYRRFLELAESKTPYIASHIMPLTEKEYERLAERFGGDLVWDMMQEMENRQDLRKRYTNLSRTLLNWCKRENGEN